MTDIISLTLDYWDEDHNCAISTACGTMEYFNKKEKDNFLNAFVGFGGGLGEGSACGAVVGIFAAMSKILADHDYKGDQIRLTLDKFKEDFIQNYGSINCKSILTEFRKKGGIDYDDPKRKLKCTEIVKNSVTEAKRLLEIDINPLIPIMRRFDVLNG